MIHLKFVKMEFESIAHILEYSCPKKDSHNLFAVVLDSTLPYNKDKLWMVRLTLTDDSIKEEGLILKGVEIIMFAFSKNDLPSVSKVGDIIRLIAIQTQIYNNIKSLIFNSSVNSNWAVFDSLMPCCKEIRLKMFLD